MNDKMSQKFLQRGIGKRRSYAEGNGSAKNKEFVNWKKEIIFVAGFLPNGCAGSYAGRRGRCERGWLGLKMVGQAVCKGRLSRQWASTGKSDREYSFWRLPFTRVGFALNFQGIECCS
jgi:hypothetical protein